MFACLPLPLKSNFSVVETIVLVTVVGVVELGYVLNFNVRSTDPVNPLKLGIPLPICKNG